MRRKDHQLAVDSFCRPVGMARKHWASGTVLRIAKRKSNWYETKYFCVAVDAPIGYGSWLEVKDICPLTPLELLALQCDDCVTVRVDRER